MTTGLDYMF